ncbi:MAG: VWA domain-containing protein, partial [Candidatus Hermodarchaeota archaeon]
FDGAYDAALFWTYVTEQFGQVQTEPGRGLDAIYEFWESAQQVGGCTDAFYVFEKMMDRLGYGWITIEDVFKGFVTANYAKCLDWGNNPSIYRYYDEAQPPGPFASVRLEIDEILPYGNVITDNDFIPFQWAPKYYRVRPQIRGASVPIIVEVDQMTTEELFFEILVINNNHLVSHYTLSDSIHYEQTIMAKPGDELVLIVATMEQQNVDPVTYRYSFSSGGANLAVNILSPRSHSENLYAIVGPYYDPGKFTLITEVLSNWLPVPNIERDDFIVQVGDKEAEVISCTNIFGNYYLEVQAPIQSYWGYQNLTVRYASAIDREFDAISYDFGIYDNVIVLDASGSMGLNEKLDAAQAAARLFVNSFYNLTQVGLVEFYDDALLLESLELVEINRNTLIFKINGITAGGRTSIGDGLFTAQNDLYLNGNNSFINRHIIVLTDGKENEGRYIQDIEHLIKDNYTQVHAILMGVDTDAAKLQELAFQTRGSVFFTFDPASGTVTSDLADIYRSIAEITKDEERVFSTLKTINSGQWTIDESFYLDPAKSATIVLNYKATSPFIGQLVVLKDPNGNNHSATFPSGRQGPINYYGHYVWYLEKPIAGMYNIIVEDGSGFVEYFAEASVDSPISINMHFPLPDRRDIKHPSLRVTGCEFPILVTLTDNAPIKGATIKAKITTGTSYTDNHYWNLWLYDDGEHGDGFPNDGVYGNLFTRTMEPGTYTVKVKANGYSQQIGENFTREITQAFHLIPDTDGDKDGLPDGWELRYGLDSTKTTGNDGPSGDNDLDGLTNYEELKFGTRPIDTDTDNGGENDYSEVQASRDPYFKYDDHLVAPSIIAEPGNQNVTIRFQPRPDIVSFTLYRASSTNSNFVLVSNSIQALSNTYTDIGLTNDILYYYKMIAVNTQGAESDFSPIVSAIPRINTTRPIGFVVINNGEKYTSSTTVMLKIITTDPTIEFMRVSQDTSFEGVSWIPYQTEMVFTLAGGGPQFVYVELKTIYGNIGGDDRGLYAHDGIFVDPNYTPSTTTTTSAETNWPTLDVVISILTLAVIIEKRRKKNRTET